MHHNPSISDLTFCSCKPRYMLPLGLFDTVFMKSTKIHSPPQTLIPNLTSSSLHVKLHLNNPIIPIVSKFHPNLSYPIYILLEAHQPVSSRFAESRFAESRFVETRFAESRFAESHFVETFIIIIIILLVLMSSRYRFAESRFVESRFAESRFAETFIIIIIILLVLLAMFR